MNLQFSCLEDNLLVKIEEREKDLILEESKYGKKFYSLEIKQNDGETMHLIISKKDNTNNKEEEFMFQYTFSNEKSKSKYAIKNTALDVTKKELGDYSIKLFPIEKYDTYDLVYIIRFVYEEDGKVPSKPDVSMKIKKQKVIEYHKSTVEENKLYFEITDVKKNYSYIQIIAKIKDKENVDYLSYDLYKFDYEKNEDKKKSYSKTLIVIFLIIGTIIMIAIIVAISILCHKDIDLMDNVQKISFQTDEDNKTGGLLNGELDSINSN